MDVRRFCIPLRQTCSQWLSFFSLFCTPHNTLLALESGSFRVFLFHLSSVLLAVAGYLIIAYQRYLIGRRDEFEEGLNMRET